MMLRPLSKFLRVIYYDLAYTLIHLLRVVKKVSAAAMSLSSCVWQ